MPRPPRAALATMFGAAILEAGAPPVARAWDGAAWADPSAFLGPVDAGMKQHLQELVATGAAEGRVTGRLGQIGDSITLSSAYFRNAELNGPSANATGHDYAPIRSWLAYAGVQPADPQSFYSTAGKGPAWGNQGGWTVEDAAAAGHPAAGVLVGESGVAGQYSWVLMMFGTNDIDAGGWSPAPWKEAYRALVLGYEALGVVPVLSTIPPEQAHAGDGRVEAANAAILELAAEERIPWVDYHGMILHYQPTNWVGTLIGADGTHPTALTGGAGFSESALTSTDGYALRTKLTFDVAEKLLGIVWNDGPPDPVTVTPVRPPSPERARLAVFPNPARGTASFRMGRDGLPGTPLEIFDVSGRLVRTLAMRGDPGGPVEVPWDLRATGDARLPDGVYFARVRSASHAALVRVVIRR